MKVRAWIEDSIRYSYRLYHSHYIVQGGSSEGRVERRHNWSITREKM